MTGVFVCAIAAKGNTIAKRMIVFFIDFIYPIKIIDFMYQLKYFPTIGTLLPTPNALGEMRMIGQN